MVATTCGCALMLPDALVPAFDGANKMWQELHHSRLWWMHSPQASMYFGAVAFEWDQKKDCHDDRRILQYFICMGHVDEVGADYSWFYWC